MLIEFRLSNFRPVAEGQVLSLVATSTEDSTERPRSVTGSNKKLLLPVVAIYGANASGKTSVLAGLAYMRRKLSSCAIESGSRKAVRRANRSPGVACRDKRRSSKSPH